METMSLSHVNTITFKVSIDSSPSCLPYSHRLAFHSGTTNLREHLMNRHSGSYKGDGVKKEKQGTLQAFTRPKRSS